MAETSWGQRVAGSFSSFMARTFSSRSGEPEPLNDAQARRPPFGHLVPFGAQQLRSVPRNDWGADGFAYTGGKTTVNPIGAGVVVRHGVPVLAGPAIGVQLGTAVLFNNQMQNQGIQPGTLPLYSPSEIAALLGPTYAQSAALGAGPPAAYINSPGG